MRRQARILKGRASTERGRGLILICIISFEEKAKFCVSFVQVCIDVPTSKNIIFIEVVIRVIINILSCPLLLIVIF